MIGSTSTALHLVPSLAGGPQPDPSRSAPSTAEAALEVVSPTVAAGPIRLRIVGERGMATAEYAVGLIAACAFAVVLYKVVTGGTALGLITALVKVALAVMAR